MTKDMTYHYPNPNRGRRSSPLLWILFLLLLVVWLWFYIGNSWFSSPTRSAEGEAPVEETSTIEALPEVGSPVLPEPTFVNWEDCCTLTVLYSSQWGSPLIIFPPRWEFYIVEYLPCEHGACWAEVTTVAGDKLVRGWILLSGGEDWEAGKGPCHKCL